MEKRTAPSDNSSGNQGTIYAVAALFEGEFSLDWLIESTFLKASQILFAMEQGVKEGWLDKGEGAAVFFFRDSSKQEYFRHQLKPEEREIMHQRIVALLKIGVTEEGEKAEILGHHLLQISNDVDGCRWLIKAGDSYRRNFQNKKALQCFEKCLHDLRPLSGEDADILFAEAANTYSKISTAKQSITEVLSLLYEAMDRAKRCDNKMYLSLLEMQLAKNKWLQSEYSSALKHIESATSMVEDLNDPKLSRSAITFIISFLHWQGHFRKAIQSYEKFVTDGEKLPYGGFPLRVAIIVGVSYARLGHVNQGLGMLENIRRHCIEIGDRYMAALAVLGIGAIMLEIGRTDDALQHLEHALEEARRENHEFIVITVALFLAHAYYLKGEIDRSLSHLREFLQQSEQTQMDVRFVPSLLDLCWEMEQGKLPRIPGLSLAKEINLTLGGENIFLKGVAHRYRALVQRQQGLPGDEIIQALQISIKWLEESGHQIELAKSRLELAHQYLLADERDRAKELALEASKFLASVNKALIPHDLRLLIEDTPLGEDLLMNILELSKKIVSIRDNKELVQYILSTAMKITGAERGAIFLFEDDEPFPSQTHLRLSRNISSEEVDYKGFESSRKMIEEVALTGQGRIFQTNPNVDSHAAENVRSQICVPMILRDKVVGVLYHDNRFLASAFKESDLEPLSYFASQAAIALDNAKAYEELNQINAQLKEAKHYYEEMNLQNPHFEEIIGKSPGIQKILSQVDQVADKDVTVLILGETGVGKELIARAIHRHSHRCDNPFISVNCNALTESLMTSELFGHEKGAFTGAARKRVGRFELSDKGTLFLDEMGELPMEIQVRLLRVLQTKEFERVGGEETLRSDFRLVVATNCNLQQAVKAGKFREDLYYRLNVFPIYVPPLRERREDIPILVHYFVKTYATKLGTSFEAIPKNEIDKLMRYDWPGNVRELENIIERSVILSSGPFFRVAKLDDAQRGFTQEQPAMTLEEVERKHIQRVLQGTGWKVRGPGGAAEILNVHPSTLTSRMKKLGIQRPKL